MNDKVKELVEWVAEKHWLSHINHARLSDPSIPNYNETDFRKQTLINHKMFEDFAKQILSHPDLALIDREKAPPPERWSGIPLNEDVASIYLPVIPLADAIKEAQSE